MRIVIKGADFSANSIGKVGRDLSFEFTWEDTSWIQNSGIPATLTGLISSGSPYGGADWYEGSNGGNTWEKRINNNNRFASFPIEVTAGMLIRVVWIGNTATVPTVLALDSDKNPLTPCNTTNALWQTDSDSHYFTVPQGASYIIVTASQMRPGTKVTGTMPE